MINLSASKKTDTINLDVKPVTNVHIGDLSSSSENFHKKQPGLAPERSRKVLRLCILMEKAQRTHMQNCRRKI